MSVPPQSSLAIWTRRVAWLGAVACLPLLLLDWPVRRDPHYHPHFPLEAWYGFFPVVSLLAGLLLAGMAKLWQLLVRRPEEYYGE